MWILKEIVFWVCVLYGLAYYYREDKPDKRMYFEEMCNWNGLAIHFWVLRSVILLLDYLGVKPVFLLVDAFIYILRCPFIFFGDIIFLSKSITNSVTFYVLDIVLRKVLCTPSMMLKDIFFTLLALLEDVQNSKVCESVIHYSCRERMPGFPEFGCTENIVLIFLLSVLFHKLSVSTKTITNVSLAIICMPLVSYIFIPVGLCSFIILFSMIIIMIIYIPAVCSLALSTIELLLIFGKFYRYPRILPDGLKLVCGKVEDCCYICYAENVSMVRLYFCGHLGCCDSCASTIKEDSGKCPFCRAPIRYFVSDRKPFVHVTICTIVITLSLLCLAVVHVVIGV